MYIVSTTFPTTSKAQCDQKPTADFVERKKYCSAYNRTSAEIQMKSLLIESANNRCVYCNMSGKNGVGRNFILFYFYLFIYFFFFFFFLQPEQPKCTFWLIDFLFLKDKGSKTTDYL